MYVAAKKIQGFKLGSPKNFTDEGRAKGRLVHSLNAQNNKNNTRASNYIVQLRNIGMTLPRDC